MSRVSIEADRMATPDTGLDPIVSAALTGAAVGAAVSAVFGVITLLINNAATKKRELTKLAYEAGRLEWETHIKVADSQKRDVALYPLGYYIAFHRSLSTTDLKAADFKKAYEEAEAVRAIIDGQKKP